MCYILSESAYMYFLSVKVNKMLHIALFLLCLFLDLRNNLRDVVTKVQTQMDFRNNIAHVVT